MNAICGIVQRDGAMAQNEQLLPYLAEPARPFSQKPRAWSRGTVALGCAMQPISPQSLEEELPVYDPALKLAITADVRLDNRDELCAALAVDHAQRHSIPDSRLLLLAYRKWGTTLIPRLLGDFAFAIWDEQERRLFCGRDHIGVRPFYYHLADSHFTFASDMASLLAGGVPVELDLAYLSAQLHQPFAFVDNVHTVYAPIQKLPPGGAMVVAAGAVRRWRWWRPAQVPQRTRLDEDAAADELLALLKASLQARLRTLFPVGGHISGGLDCSTVTVLAHRLLRQQGRDVTAFSWAPPLAGDIGTVEADERALIQKLSRREGFDVYFSAVTLQDVARLQLRDDGRCHDADFIPELSVRRSAAETGVRVLLSGWGGDEFVTHNSQSYFPVLFLRGRWLKLHRLLAQQARNRRTSLWGAYKSLLLRPFLPDAIRFRRASRLMMAGRSLPQLSALLQPGFYRGLQDARPLSPRRIAPPWKGVRRNQLSRLAHGYLTARIEGWAIAGARSGISYTYPLLDRRLVEFALGLPPDLHFRNGWKRYLFRRALSGTLPDDLLWKTSKQDPSLNAGRQYIREARYRLLPSLLQELLVPGRNYHLLMANSARAVLDTHANRPLTDEDRLALNLVRQAVLFELLVNPALGQTVQERVNAIDETGPIY